METTIVFEPIFHQNTERVLLCHPYNASINQLIRTLPGVRWSQTNKAWHIPLLEPACKQALEKLRAAANTDITALTAYLHKRKAALASMPKKDDSAKGNHNGGQHAIAIKSQPTEHAQKTSLNVAINLSEANLEALQKNW